MPPCMQTSVAPTSHASRHPLGDLVQREVVGVRVVAALRERAEPAARVTDVGEVEVAVDDVGDRVPDRGGPDLVGRPGQRVELDPGGVEQQQRLVVVQHRPALGLGQRRGDLGADRAASRTLDRGAGCPPAPPRRSGAGRRRRHGAAHPRPARTRALRPSAADPDASSPEITASIAAVVDVYSASGSCQLCPTGRTSGIASPFGADSAATGARIRPASHGSGRAAHSG